MVVRPVCQTPDAGHVHSVEPRPTKFVSPAKSGDEPPIHCLGTSISGARHFRNSRFVASVSVGANSLGDRASIPVWIVRLASPLCTVGSGDWLAIGGKRFK